MLGAKLPAVRLSSSISQDGGGGNAAPVVVDLPPVSKFGFAWPTDPPSSHQSLGADRSVTLTSSEGESDHSDAESTSGFPSQVEQAGDDNPSAFNRAMKLEQQRNSLEQDNGLSSLPRLSRAISMPLPSRLGHLQNPRRPSTSSTTTSPPISEVDAPEDGSNQFQELSLELADTVQTIVQTLLQISPSQVLDPAKEQFSACSLSVPTSCMSSVFTSMKNLNYLSANMAALCAASDTEPSSGGGVRSSTTWSGDPSMSMNVINDFDIGELLQSVGDTLSGAAAQLGVELVLFHGDVGMKHVAVKGDECGISFALSHIVRQVLGTARHGDSIEVGLFITTAPPPPTEGDSESGSRPAVQRSVSDWEGPLWCTFDISHNYAASESSRQVEGDKPQDDYSCPTSRSKPTFRTLILQRLLRQLDASFTSDLQPKAFHGGRACELSISLERGSPLAINARVASPPDDTSNTLLQGASIADEPTLEELAQFTETLRGKKVTLYASSRSSFAHHLTSYLTAWGLDVSISTELGVDGGPPSNESAQGRLHIPPTFSRTISGSPLRATTFPEGEEPFAQTAAESPATPAAAKGPGQPVPAALSFIFIDDDVAVLRERLKKLRLPQAYPLTLSRKRPSLAPHHRPRSATQVYRATSPVVIVHFTSLSNYKLVKEVIQSDLTIYPGGSSCVPEVMIIPKPAGPRRFLTALHTAVTKPVVDPFFAPIATSPISTGQGSFMDPHNNDGAPGTPSPKSPTSKSNRSNSDRSTRSPKDAPGDALSLPIPSPLSMSDRMEYFSEAAAKMGASPSQGLVIQSPSGQPAGIFFHPKGKGKSSTTIIDRDRSQFLVATDRTRVPGARRPSNGTDVKSPLSSQGSVSFSSLHSVSTGTNHVASSEPQTFGAGVSPTQRAKKPGSPITEDVPATVSPPRRVPIITPTNALAKSPATTPQADTVSGGTPSTRRPANRRDSKQNPQAAKAAVDAGIVVPPISVLIVDDNPINQTILSTFMKKKKIKYDVAKNGQEAVTKWRTGGFHLILMDIQMPIMDGIQATKEIRTMEKMNSSSGFPLATPRSEGLPHTPPLRTPSEAPSTSTSSPYRSSVIIVALTASSLQSDRVAALAAGCNDFLTKPVSLQWLNNKIIEWGSIKALQMWADLKPEVNKSISAGQAAQARNVARRLHVPEGRSTPTGPQSRSSSATRPALPPPEPAPPAPERLPPDTTVTSVSKGDLSDSPLSSDSEPAAPEHLARKAPASEPPEHLNVQTDAPDVSTDSLTDSTETPDRPTADQQARDEDSPSSDQYSTADDI
ncbi:hypothetical protein FIBSPDRAFT_867557 [Athelia psychrophila]|uniref:Response regulatory domain-containing protein n=1 Tax=Athelia psychrophila TaxID=1759441 RepID=A0A166DUT4_9AGAM|nr:hypothetical protein FIBSPDRAFT_867557 [Fibularhizoctonia sp. CBS 109695]